jgi:hypothetical protein
MCYVVKHKGKTPCSNKERRRQGECEKERKEGERGRKKRRRKFIRKSKNCDCIIGYIFEPFKQS